MRDIIYVNNTPIPCVDDSKKYFLNALTILYGTSGTGKSSLITHIINTLRDVVPMGIVCCPTNEMNGDYDNVIPSQCVYDDLTPNLMKNIFTRQTNVLAMYNMVRDIDSLQSLYEMVCDVASNDKINKLNKILRNCIDKVNLTYNKDDIESTIEEFRTKHTKKIVRVMRSCIIDNLQVLSNANLNDMQRVILSNLEINPNLLLIIDDCAASIKDWKDLVETRKLFFQGRHYKVTTILTMQNESIIPVPLRANAHVSIFTTEKIVNTYFRKDSSGVSPDEKKRISQIASVIFASPDDKTRPNYKKLVSFSQIIKTEEKIQYMIANPKKKKFGSAALWEMCDKVKREVPTSLTCNSFSKMFNLKSHAQLD